MKLKKSKVYFFIYFLSIFFLLFEILFSEKNVFKFLNNIEIISNNKITMTYKLKELEMLESFLKNFDNSKEFRKIVVKDKLFYKERDEKVLLYDISNEQ